MIGPGELARWVDVWRLRGVGLANTGWFAVQVDHDYIWLSLLGVTGLVHRLRGEMGAQRCRFETIEGILGVATYLVFSYVGVLD